MTAVAMRPIKLKGKVGYLNADDQVREAMVWGDREERKEAMQWLLDNGQFFTTNIHDLGERFPVLDFGGYSAHHGDWIIRITETNEFFTLSHRVVARCYEVVR